MVDNPPPGVEVAGFVLKQGFFPNLAAADIAVQGPQVNLWALPLGSRYAAFEEELDVITDSTPLVSVEHSFGSSPGGHAERLGADFQARVLLAGIGMMDGWEPQDGTDYYAIQGPSDINRALDGLQSDPFGYAVTPSGGNGFTELNSGFTGFDPGGQHGDVISSGSIRESPDASSAATYLPGRGRPVRLARGLAAVAILTLAGTAMVGCAMAGRPTLEEARAETEAVLQRIADEVPDGVIETRTSDAAYQACDGGGYYSINHWVVTPGSEFDGEAFVDALPGRLGDDFVVAEAVDIKSPAVALNHASGAALDVVVLGPEGDVVVDLLGLAPCGDGEPPADGLDRR